ncbi:Uncharacterized MFS-type transporter YtbD, partial [Pseudomonas sp. FEN]
AHCLAGADPQRLCHRDDRVRHRWPVTHHRHRPGCRLALRRPAGQPLCLGCRHRRPGADRPHWQGPAKTPAAVADGAVHPRQPAGLASAELRIADPRANRHRPGPRGVLLHRLDHRHQPGAEGKGRQRDCHHVHWPDRGPGHGRTAGDLYRPALWLARNLSRRVRPGRDRLYWQPDLCAEEHRPQQTGVTDPATASAQATAPAAGVRDDRGRVWRHLYCLYLPRPDPAGHLRLPARHCQPGAAGLRCLGGGGQYLGRETGGQARSHRGAEDHFPAAGGRAVRADLHRGQPMAGPVDRIGLGRGSLRQRTGPADLCGTPGRASHTAGGGCRVGPEHRRLQPWHCRRGLDRRGDRRQPGTDPYHLDWRPGGAAGPGADGLEWSAGSTGAGVCRTRARLGADGRRTL